jgi:UDP-N-acetylmuramoyl-tripeptide--D-alanyl-D-alanine ligase
MKNIKITLKDLFNLPGAVIYNPDRYKDVSAVTIDTRNIPINSLFIAIEGNNFDGHTFLKEAVKRGAKAIVINENKLSIADKIKVPVITVPDTTTALGSIAGIWRNKLNAKIISITGSAGKTSTKEILVQLLSEKFKVNKTIGNYNNHIGVPLTILNTQNKYDMLVAELGTNHFGEIKYTAEIIRPDFALITNIADSHLEFFKDREGVLKEKWVLAEVTESREGLVFINNDDKLLRISGDKLAKKITYAFDNEADVRGKITGYNGEGQTEIEISYGKKKVRLSLPLYGEQNAKNLLAAAAIAFKLGLSVKQIKDGVKKLKAADKRLNVRKHNNITVIDDTYNANPESMNASLDLLGKMTSFKSRIAVLGDMLELGQDEIELHKNLEATIKKNKIDSVFTIGNRMKNLSELLKNTGIEAKHFNIREALSSFLDKRDFRDSVILVKGSRGMKMEEFVQVIESREN